MTAATPDIESPTAAAPETAGPSSPTGHQWRLAVALVGGTRLVFLAAAWLGRRLLDGDGPGGVLEIWRRWDADLYLKIAEGGYAGSDAWSEAFLPGLPGAVRGLSALGIPPVAAGMAVTAVASVVACAYLLRLVDDTAARGGPGAAGLDAAAGSRAALYLLVFPTAVFLVAPYTEALFLAGAIPAFHHARRGEWSRAALPAALATVSRTAGVFVLAGLAVEWWRHRPRAPLWQPAAALAVGAGPLVAYVGFLWATRGDPTFLLTAQREGWGRQLVGPVDALATTVGAWSGDYGPGLAVAWRIEVLAAAAGVALVVALVRRREWGYVAFVAPLWALLISSSWYYSLPRMLLGCFPLVIVLAAWTSRSRLRGDLLLVAFAAAATLGVLTFTAGAWFF